MANRARGEQGVRIGGKTVAIALNLGALAAIEAEFDVDSYEDVFADVLGAEKVSASKVKRLLSAALVANGHDDLDEALDALMPADMAALSLDLLSRAFPDPDAKRKAKPANP
jgi:hypothetical protein